MSIPHNSLNLHTSNGDHGTPAGPGRATTAPVKPRYHRIEIGGSAGRRGDPHSTAVPLQRR